MDERVYFAYIVASKSRTLYIGMTGDLRMRVYQHKEKLHPDGFAATYNCDRLVWFERFLDPNNAIATGKAVEGMEARIRRSHSSRRATRPGKDLSEGWYPKSEAPKR